MKQQKLSIGINGMNGMDAGKKQGQKHLPGSVSCIFFWKDLCRVELASKKLKDLHLNYDYDGTRHVEKNAPFE